MLVNYTPKILHVATIDFENYRKPTRGYNGLIYDPKKIFNKTSRLDTSQMWYEEFFQKNRPYNLVTIETEQGPVELAKKLSKEFGVKCDFGIGAFLVHLEATPEQASALIKDLRENPKKYFNSAEKDHFMKPAQQTKLLQ